MKKKDWCRHIKGEEYYIPRKSYWTGFGIVIPLSWRMCPICGAERPTRTNIKAAKMVAELDGDL